MVSERSGTGVIVMKSLDITVKDFLAEVHTAKDADAVANGCRSLINKLHQLGYYHGDNHFANIMMKRVSSGLFPEPNTVQTLLGRYRLYLIDLGKAGKLSEPGTIRGKEVSAAKRLRDDNVILEEEMRQITARFRPETIEALII
jgi:predicted unusual protein kinase regulating ubiquinone biosynthesis (AarF/ABC1/UbiB family)